MSANIKIYCKNTNQYVDVTGGDTLQQLYNTLQPQVGEGMIAARVNNKTKDLQYPIFGPKQVEFIGIDTASGMRVYIHSLCMILYKAINDLYPGRRLIVEHAIGGGYFCNFKHEKRAITPAIVKDIKKRMREIVDSNIAFERCEQLTTDVRAMFVKQGLNDKVRLLDSSHELYTVYYKLGDIIDSFNSPLAPGTGHISTFELEAYKDGMLLLAPSKDNLKVPARPVNQRKLYQAFTDYEDFNCVINVADVGELNNAINNKQASMLIAVAEALHEHKFAKIASTIAKRFKKGGAKVVLIAGPSSSGKTTSSKRLAIQLMTNYIKPKVISLDNYFVDRTRTPRDENGDYDYESLYALDLEQFNADITRLIAGEEVKMPTYNFETGMREYRGDTLKLDADNILLMEGIHGLNPELTTLIPNEQKFRLYVSALTTLNIDDHNWISTSDSRLLRRIVRDYKYRGVSAINTIARWPSVRRGEEKWIFPFQENADAMFNSSLLFELAVMKRYVEPILRQVPNDTPHYEEAYRLLRFLSYFKPLAEKDIPRTSLLREFLGGSTFQY